MLTISAMQGTHNTCNARKYTAFRSDNEAGIFHTGIHKCVYKSTKIRPEEEVRKALYNRCRHPTK